MSGPDLDALLRQLPGVMRDALRAQDPAFAREMAEEFLAADEPTRADIVAFFESDGPRLVHEAKLQIEDGTPTSGDLARWVEGGAPERYLYPLPPLPSDWPSWRLLLTAAAIGVLGGLLALGRWPW